MKYIVSYASNGYFPSQKRLCNSARSFNIKTFSYTDKWLKKTDFYRKNQIILSQRRGAGYWLWKPYIILETFKRMTQNDFLVYIDADAIVINPLEPLFELCKHNKGIMLFDNSIHKNKTWIKRDCFVLMDADSKEYYEAGQSMGGFIVMQKNDFTYSFVNEWLQYAQDPRIITDAPNEMGLPNLPEFKEHRHDQAILSIMYLKKKLPLFRDPSQYGNPYKMEQFRIDGEYLINGLYADNDLIKDNSPYTTLINLQDPEIKSDLSLKKHIKANLKKIFKSLN